MTALSGVTTVAMVATVVVTVETAVAVVTATAIGTVIVIGIPSLPTNQAARSCPSRTSSSPRSSEAHAGQPLSGHHERPRSDPGPLCVGNAYGPDAERRSASSMTSTTRSLSASVNTSGGLILMTL